MWCCVPVTVFCVFYMTSLCVESQTQPPPAVFIWPSTVFVVPFPPSSPSLRFSYSPVTLISMCPEQYEWVSTTTETAPPLRPDWNAPPSSLPPLLAHLPPPTSSHQLSQDCTACCPPAWLPASSTGWTCNRKHNSPHCLLPTTSCSSLEPPGSGCQNPSTPP